jgi:membrane protein
MQPALNAIWKIDSSGTPISRLIRARAASVGLVVSLGFLMMVSLVVSAGLTALGDYLNAVLPFGKQTRARHLGALGSPRRYDRKSG